MAAQVFILVPEDVTLELDVDRSLDPPRFETRRFNFVRFFIQFLLDHETFSTRAGVLESADIEAAFKAQAHPAVVPLPRGHFEKLKKAYEARKYEGTIWRGLTSFFTAIDDASSKDPRAAAAALDKPKEDSASLAEAS
jgi:hypothetical protein